MVTALSEGAIGALTDATGVSDHPQADVRTLLIPIDITAGGCNFSRVNSPGKVLWDIDSHNP